MWLLAQYPNLKQGIELNFVICSVAKYSTNLPMVLTSEARLSWLSSKPTHLGLVWFTLGLFVFFTLLLVTLMWLLLNFVGLSSDGNEFRRECRFLGGESGWYGDLTDFLGDDFDRDLALLSVDEK